MWFCLCGLTLRTFAFYSLPKSLSLIVYEMSNAPKSHNLNIQAYTLDEVLGLFDLPYQLSVEDMKRAKKKVLMLHPDKSRLSPDYFLFYKKAYEIVYQFYEQQTRQSREVNERATVYQPVVQDHNKTTQNRISKTIQSMSTQSFQEKFNELFESNQMGDRPDPRRNDWFTQEEALYQIPDRVSANAMGQVFDTVKKTTNGLVRYRGVQDMTSTSSAGSSHLYGDDADPEADADYVSCDPFSKLKFDDLRKVHKDHTVFAVGEADLANIQTYRSVDEFSRARSQHSYEPIAKERAEGVLLNQSRAMQEALMRKEFEAKKRAEQYAVKNRSVLASFLQLGNG